MSASPVSDSASSAGGICTGRPEPELRGSARARGGGGRFVISGGVAPPKAEIHSFLVSRIQDRLQPDPSAMGQQVTKDIRSRLEHCTLEELLTDDKFIEELQPHLPGLPKRSQNKLAKILALWENTPSKDSHSRSQPNPPRKERNSRAYQLRPLWSIKSEDISIPQNVAETLKQNYCNLLCRSSKNGTDLQSPADHYEYTCAVETGRTLDRILWRFLTTFYYDFISELDATKRRFSTVENGGLAFVVAVICQSGKHSPEVVREKVVGWIKVGRRYRGFMDALCAGCLILFPEQIGDLVWEKYVPIKGDISAKVVQFLQDLGMVDKCEEEGWNDLSHKILQTLRKPFRCLIAFQFQPGQQSQIGGVANSSLVPVAGDADIHRSERSILGHERVEEIQDMDVNNPPSSRILDSRALPRQVANRVTKTKRKKGTTSVRRQLHNFARDLTAHQTHRPEKNLPLVVRQSHHASRAHRSETQHGRYPQSRSPRSPTQCLASAPSDPGQWHLATNHQNDRWLSPVSINGRGRDPLSDISLNAMNHDVDQEQRTGESISERAGFGRISALLNHDSNTPAIRAIQFEKHILQRIVLERPADILGEIWFGSPAGFEPCISLRLSKASGDIVKLSGQDVVIPNSTPNTNGKFEGVYSIELECFRQSIQRDGFGAIFWYEIGEHGFVSVQVIDKELMADFIQASQAAIDVLPILDTVSTSSSA